MTWTRIGDDFLDRPDLLDVSRTARLLYVEALVYCNRHLTDGYLRAGALRRLTDTDDPEGAAAELVAAGVLEPLGDAGWQLDWSDQLTAEEVKRRQAMDRGRKERSRRHKAGDHSLCRPSFCAKAPVTRDGMQERMQDARHDGRSPDPTRPDRREGEGEGWPPDGPDGPPGAAQVATAAPSRLHNRGRACTCLDPAFDGPATDPDAECVRCGGGRP